MISSAAAMIRRGARIASPAIPCNMLEKSHKQCFGGTRSRLLVSHLTRDGRIRRRRFSTLRRQAGLHDRRVDEALYRATEEPGVTASVPDDFGSAPVLPDPLHLLAWMDETIGDAAVDEPSPHRHPRSQRQ